MKNHGGQFFALMLLCCVFETNAHAASDLQIAQASAQSASPAPADQSAQPAQSDQPAASPSQPADAAEPVGNVATLKGTATVIRNGVTGPLKLQDDIFKGDTLETGKNSTLVVTFTDDTTLNLSATSRIVVDNFVYQDGGKDNAALINVTRGTMAFVAAAVAKTGDMKIETPTATLGIRGTTGVVDVPEGATAANANNVGIKLYPDADGKVGRIEVKARDGAPLGMLTQGASGFTVRGTMVSGFGMRMAAIPMIMSPQMVARDRGFVQRVHAMQSIGRNIVIQQRNFRLQNPQLHQPGFGRPGFNPPRPQRPGFNQPGQRGGLNRPGQTLPGQHGQLGRPGPATQPGGPTRSGIQHALPGPPGLQQQGNLPNGYRQPSGVPGTPTMQGPAGILNRLGVLGRTGVPQLPSALPRAGQPVLPSLQRKPLQLPKQKQPPPKDQR
ncbi:MAG TPA: FecR domain-containing protein [Afipia sp.]